MGRLFLEHVGGPEVYKCAVCSTSLTTFSHLLSMCFLGNTGRAFLFNYVTNLTFSEIQDRVMLTGRHLIRDASCKKCETKIGWRYEHAFEENQRYKEGKIILETYHIKEVSQYYP